MSGPRAHHRERGRPLLLLERLGHLLAQPPDPIGGERAQLVRKYSREVGSIDHAVGGLPQRELPRRLASSRACLPLYGRLAHPA